MDKAKTSQIDTSTEQKIKDAARTVFIKKGFAATRTRDIAEEAGINLALLNYYFRSKAKLFEVIMTETLVAFIQSMLVMINDEKTTLENKVQEVACRYIDLIIREPEIPTFIVSEIRNHPDVFLKKLPIKQVLSSSVLFRQHQEAVKTGKIAEPNPVQFLFNLMGLVVFPFIARPLILGGTDISVEDFNKLMQQRKKLIPVWVKAIVKAK